MNQAKNDLIKGKCVPCEGTEDPFSIEEENKYLPDVDGWEIDRSGVHKISRELTFKNFSTALAFLNQVGEIAENEGHHPDFSLYNYKHVRVELTTHAINGLSLNDFIMAAKINEVL